MKASPPDLSERAGGFPEFEHHFPVHDRTISYGFAVSRIARAILPAPVVLQPAKIYGTARSARTANPGIPGFPAVGSNNRQFACYTSRWRPRPLFKAVTTITVMLEVVRVNAKESAYESASEGSRYDRSIDRKVRFGPGIRMYKAEVDRVAPGLR